MGRKIICKRCNQECCTCTGCKIVGEYCKPCADILKEEDLKLQEKNAANKNK